MVEVAVVIAIIGILMVIAIPRLVAPSASGSDRAAQASVVFIYEAERIVTKSLNGFSTNAFALAEHAPEVTVLGSSEQSTAPALASVAVDDITDGRLGIAVMSDSGTCWYLMAVPGGDHRGVAYARDDDPGPAECTGVTALTMTEPPAGANVDWQNAEDL